MRIALFQYFQIICLIVAVLYFKRLGKWQIRVFLPLLIFTNLAEMAGVNARILGWYPNYFIYNIYLVGSATFMIYLFYRMLSMNQRMKQIFIIIGVLLLTFLLLNISFLEGFHQFNSLSLVLIELLNIILSCIVLFQLVFHQDNSKSLFKEPYFWINTGTLFFSLGTIVLFGLQKYIINNHLQIENKSLYHALAPILNIILYSAWSYGFLQCRKTSS